jgi:hypothetical protein
MASIASTFTFGIPSSFSHSEKILESYLIRTCAEWGVSLLLSLLTATLGMDEPITYNRA